MDGENGQSGRERKKEGTARARNRPPKWWKDGYWELLYAQLLDEPFLGEQFRVLVAGRQGEPPIYRTWGGMWSAAVERKAVINTGVWVNCLNRLNNSCTAPLYVWPDWDPVAQEWPVEVEVDVPFDY